MTKVISAFPGTGKTYVTEYHQFPGKVLDSDSSDYSWLQTDLGKIRNPNFPVNYMDHIKKNIGTVAFILISSHKEVRAALVNEGIRFTLAYPERNLKEEYLERFKQRESSQVFIDHIADNWDVYLEQLEQQKGCDKLVLGKNQYLSDVLTI